MMRFFVLRANRLEHIEPAQCRTAQEVVWVDLCDPSADEEHFVEALLGVDVPTRQEMAEIEESARLYRDGEAVVMTAVVVDGVAEGRPSRSQATFVLSPDRLVTIRYANPLPFRGFDAKRAKQPDLHLTGDEIFVSLLESIVERIADILEAVAQRLYEVSSAIFLDKVKGSSAADRSGDLRTLLIQLGRKNLTLAVVRESLMSLSRLTPFARQTAAWMKTGGGARLKSIERDVRSLSEYEAQISAEISFLQESTLGLINIEQNAIIKVFSIASVLFLPPTLVGTVYGMNFRYMPELDWRLGYPLALMLMVASAVVPYWWFRRRGWL
jgi:magnesium transporter